MRIKAKQFSRDEKLKGNERTTNGFEIHINRSKHQILGRKLKCEKGFPGVSKRMALEKRRKTLFYEYHNRHNSNKLIDHRIGERDSMITKENKIMMRFKAERMHMFNKKLIFNLCDSEVLTHQGQTLKDIEQFGGIHDEDDEDLENNGTLQKSFVESAHFGGGMFTKSKQNRESVIEDLINESKKRKAERQYIKEETLAATEQLDKEWEVLGPVVIDKFDAKPLVKTTIMEPVIKKRESSYDILINQLKFQSYSIAPKSIQENEIFTSVNKNPVSISIADESNKAEATENKNDLNESQYDQKWSMVNLTELMPFIKECKRLEELVSQIPSKHLKPKFNVSENQNLQNNNRPIKPDTLNQLIHLIIPDGYQSLKDSIKTTKIESQAVIFELLLKNNHLSIGTDYKTAFLKLTENLMHCIEEGDFTWENLPIYVLQFRFLMWIYKKECSAASVEQFLLKIEYLCNDCSLSISGLKFLVCFIVLYVNLEETEEIIKLQKIGLALASKLLSQLDSSSIQHATYGLLCCYLLLQNAKRTSTIYTDAVMFLLECIKIYGVRIIPVDFSHSNEKGSKKLVHKHKPQGLNFKIILQNENKINTEGNNFNIFYTSIVFIKEFIKVYIKYPEYKIWLKSIESSVIGPNMELHLSPVKEEIFDLKALLKSQSHHIPTLAKLAKKPKALCQYEPSFKNIYSSTKRSHESVSSQKQVDKLLLRRYKKEKKGAMHELRKDRIFLTNIKLKEQFQSDKDRKRKLNMILHCGALQQEELRRRHRQIK